MATQPITIHALGPFRIHTAEGPLPHFRKPPRRPLDLAKILVAAGPSGTSEIQITDTLWPDAEGDAAQRSLATTLHRLRTLLKDGKAVIRENSWLSFDVKRVWVDAWFLENELTRTLPRASAAGNPPDPASPAMLDTKDTGRITQALERYHGPLLCADGDAPWLLAPRERLHAQVLSALMRLGLHHEADANWAAAEALYRHATTLEPGSEPLCRGLIRSLAAQGREAEAAKMEQRLVATFSQKG